MLFESTTLLLQNIVHSLEEGDEPNWDDHLEYGNQCVYELFQMSRPERRKYTGQVATVLERSSRAIPHVRLMNRAIRQRDRARAIASGRAAVSEMHGVGCSIPSPTVPTNSAEVVEKPLAGRVVKKPSRVTKLRSKRASLAKRKSATAS